MSTGTIDRRFPHVASGGGTTYRIGGESITFKVTSAESEGSFFLMELVSAPGSGPPLHTHPSAETFVVLEGALEFHGLDDGRPFSLVAGPGETVHIAGGAPHTFKTVSATPARAIGVLAPGGEMERFFAEAGTLVDSGPVASDAAASEVDVTRLVATAGKHGIVFLPPREAVAGMGADEHR